MEQDSRIYVAGHDGLVGSALVRRLRAQGYTKIITQTRQELDLTDPARVQAFFEMERPQYVFLAESLIGGIWANQTYPAEFIHTNLLIQTSVIHGAYLSGVSRLMFFGSACVYPRESPQPMREAYLLSGRLEPTSEAFAIAKIAGIKMCEAYNRQYGTNFLSVIPATPYGPNDHFDLEASHVLPALIRKFHEAKLGSGPVVIWGSGAQRREFLYIDDLANACIFLMNLDESLSASILEPPSCLVNIGAGEDIAIKDLSLLVQDIVGFDGRLVFDTTKPEGARQKLLDGSRLKRLGWTPKTSLDEGIRRTYEWYAGTMHER